MPLTNSSFQLHNVLSCKGFETADSIGLTFGPCAQAKMGLVLLFFINALIRKWIGEEMEINYSFWGGLGGGFIAYLIVVTIFGHFWASFIAGMVGMLLFGFLGGVIFGGGGDYEWS